MVHIQSIIPPIHQNRLQSCSVCNNREGRAGQLCAIGSVGRLKTFVNGLIISPTYQNIREMCVLISSVIIRNTMNPVCAMLCLLR